MKHERWMPYCQYGIGSESVPVPKKRMKREVVKRVSQLSERELVRLFEQSEVEKRHHAPRYSCSHEER
jgi:hypothetical protein